MEASSPPTPLLPSRTSIWHQKRQQLIDRLAAKGIHISEDDPRLAEPLPNDCSDETPACDRSPNDVPQPSSTTPGGDQFKQHRRHADPAAASQPGESLFIGSDPASERRRRRQLQEATRQQLQEQILENQRRREVERIQKRMQALSKTMQAPPLPPIHSDALAARPRTPSDAPTSSIAMVGSDPTVERQRRKQMQAEMSRILREQIRERSIAERMAPTSPSSAATSDLSSSQNPFASPTRLRLRSPEPESAASRTPVSLAALNRDPEQEVARRRQSQADLNSYLRSQIQERQRRRSLEKSTPISALLDESPFHDRRRSRVRTPLSDYDRAESTACTPLASRGVGALLFSDREESPATLRRKKREYAEALQHQMMQSPPARNRLDFSRRSPPRSSRGGGSLLFAEKADSPGTVRRKKREYSQALQSQMLRSSGSRDDLNRESPGSAAAESRGVLPSGEKTPTPEIVRQKQRDYAEALQLQMQERRQRRLREEAEQEKPEQLLESREISSTQTATMSMSSLSIRDSEPRQRPVYGSETHHSQTNLSPSLLADSTSPDSSSTGSIFNYDPVKIAHDQKIQRKQLGEELQKQMNEQRRRKEESRIKEQQENQEDHKRILRQLEEMNRSHSSSDVAQQKLQSRSEEAEETFMKPTKEQVVQDVPSYDNPSSSQATRAPEEYDSSIRSRSPLTNESPMSNVDWNQTEAQMIRPLRELRSKLSLGSEKLRHRIAQNRQMIQVTKAKAESDLDEHSSSLPNSSCWVPVEPESESQLPVQSEFVEVPSILSNQHPHNSDEDALERFVNESESPFSRPSSSSSKRRSFWGTPAFPSAMPSNDLSEGQNFNPNNFFSEVGYQRL